MGLARAAAAAVLLGAVVMLVAVVAAPGPWTQGYVSEAGSAGQPLARAYRWGLVVLGAGVGLLGPALTRHARPAGSFAASFRAVVFLGRVRGWAVVRTARLAAVLLAAAAVLAGVSGAVPCSNRCPLPPFEPTTAADVVHTGASIVGMVVLAAAMAAVAVADGVRPALRRLAAVALTGTVPLGGALGLIMLFVGRGPAGAILERVLLVVAVSWLVGTSVVAALPRRDLPPPRRVSRSAE